MQIVFQSPQSALNPYIRVLDSVCEPMQVQGYQNNNKEHFQQTVKLMEMADYEWSSYLQYLNAYKGSASYIDPVFIMEFFKLQVDFKSYMNEPSNSECLEYVQSPSTQMRF